MITPHDPGCGYCRRTRLFFHAAVVCVIALFVLVFVGAANAATWWGPFLSNGAWVAVFALNQAAGYRSMRAAAHMRPPDLPTTRAFVPRSTVYRRANAVHLPAAPCCCPPPPEGAERSIDIVEGAERP
jgi:hypothetical protein